MTLNNHDFAAEQNRIAVEGDGAFIDYSAPVDLGQGIEKGEPVSALDQLFGYYDPYPNAPCA